MTSRELIPPIGQAEMENLASRVGAVAKVTYAQFGSESSATGMVRSVAAFSNIELVGIGVPFVGYGTAVMRVESPPGEVVYENPNINTKYDYRNRRGINWMRRRSFGKDNAKPF